MNHAQIWNPPDDDPTRLRTAEHVNRRIDLETLGAIIEAGDSPDSIRARLAELDREWHLDRAVIALFSGIGAFTASQAMLKLRYTGRFGGFALLFFAQMGFLAYHAVRGWCPPVELLRRMGFRTAREISAERAALEHRLAIEDGP